MLRKKICADYSDLLETFYGNFVPQQKQNKKKDVVHIYAAGNEKFISRLKKTTTKIQAIWEFATNFGRVWKIQVLCPPQPAIELPTELKRTTLGEAFKRSTLHNILFNHQDWNYTKFTQKHLCRGLFNIVWSLKSTKNTPALLLSAKFCEIFKNILVYRTPRGHCFWNNRR